MTSLVKAIAGKKENTNANQMTNQEGSSQAITSQNDRQGNWRGFNRGNRRTVYRRGGGGDSSGSKVFHFNL